MQVLIVRFDECACLVKLIELGLVPTGDAAQFERYLVEFDQKANLVRTLRAMRRAIAVPVEEAAAAAE